MGANIARRLMRDGHTCVVYDVSPEVTAALGEEGATPASDLADLASKLTAPRAVWVMVPAGEITETTLLKVGDVLEPGDAVIDGGNSYYRDDIRLAAKLAEITPASLTRAYLTLGGSEAVDAAKAAKRDVPCVPVAARVSSKLMTREEVGRSCAIKSGRRSTKSSTSSKKRLMSASAGCQSSAFSAVRMVRFKRLKRGASSALKMESLFSGINISSFRNLTRAAASSRHPKHSVPLFSRRRGCWSHAG
mgnify:CR=1 FL=1